MVSKEVVQLFCMQMAEIREELIRFMESTQGMMQAGSPATRLGGGGAQD